MLIAAIVVGGLTAFFFGWRAGAYAAAGAFAAFLAAAVVPSLSLWSYLLVGGGVVGVVILGPRRADPTHAARATRLMRRGLAGARAMWGGKRRR